MGAIMEQKAIKGGSTIFSSRLFGTCHCVQCPRNGESTPTSLRNRPFSLRSAEQAAGRLPWPRFPARESVRRLLRKAACPLADPVMAG